MKFAHPDQAVTLLDDLSDLWFVYVHWHDVLSIYFRFQCIFVCVTYEILFFFVILYQAVCNKFVGNPKDKAGLLSRKKHIYQINRYNEIKIKVVLTKIRKKVW